MVNGACTPIGVACIVFRLFVSSLKRLVVNSRNFVGNPLYGFRHYHLLTHSDCDYE